MPRVLDLGCGTGLMGEALRARAGWLEGVDLAPGMIAQARAKGVFDALSEGEAARFLADGVEPYDLIAVGDVAPYLGALDGLFAGAAQRLGPGGLFALSVETVEDAAPPPGWRLRPTLRYAHSAACVEDVAAGAGLVPLALPPLALPPLALLRDAGAWIDGLLGLFQRPQPSPVATPVPPAALSRPRARRR